MQLTNLSRTGNATPAGSRLQGIRILCKEVTISQSTGHGQQVLFFSPTYILGRCPAPGKMPKEGKQTQLFGLEHLRCTIKNDISFFTASREKPRGKSLCKNRISRRFLINLEAPLNLFQELLNFLKSRVPKQ